MIWIGGFGWGSGATGLYITLFFFAVNVIGLLLVLRYHRRRQRGEGDIPPFAGWPSDHPADQQEKSRALRILEERYAAGEIDRKEFLQRREDLLGD